MGGRGTLPAEVDEILSRATEENRTLMIGAISELHRDNRTTDWRALPARVRREVIRAALQLRDQGEQLDLLTEKPENSAFESDCLKAAWNHGNKCGNNGLNRSFNPFPEGSRCHRHWLDGHEYGCVCNADRSGNGKRRYVLHAGREINTWSPPRQKTKDE